MSINGEKLARHLSSLNGPMIHFALSSSAAAERLVDTARSLGFCRFEIDASAIESDAQLFDVIADRLQFPSYAGRNWDALLDSVRDMSWCPASGYCVILTGTENFLANGRQSFARFVEVMAQAADDWRGEGVPFHLIAVGGEAVGTFLEELEIRTARPGDFPLSRVGVICDEHTSVDGGD